MVLGGRGWELAVFMLEMNTSAVDGCPPSEDSE